MDGDCLDTRNRVAVSAAVVATGLVLAVIAGLIAPSSEAQQANGIVIDFSEYDTIWTDMDLSEYTEARDALAYACEQNGFSLTFGDDGRVSEINGTASDDVMSWNLWAIAKGSTEWTLLQAPYVQDPSDYTVTSWAYRSEGNEPTVAVDSAGNSIYGFSQKHRVVSLSPTTTEIVAAVGAEKVLVGTDYYSDYPESVRAARESGSIAMVGTFTSPSFEVITSTNPDIVFCDGSQYSHYQVAKQLRSVSVDSIVLYSGEGLYSVTDNIFIVGKVAGYSMAADRVIEESNYVFDSIAKSIEGYSDGSLDVMVSLEPDISPWVAGKYTYMDSIIDLLDSRNAFASWSGWTHLTANMIPQADPEVIIVITSEYRATQAEYDYLISHLPEQWKLTQAYKDGRVYMVCDGAAEMFQRYGPRTAQVAELMAMFLYPDAFETEVPKYIGDSYRDYLNYSKDLSI